MKLINRFIIFAFCVLSFQYTSQGQEHITSPVKQDQVDPLKDYWDDVDGFLDRQSQVSLNLVEQNLQSFPPALPEPSERRMALLMIDNVLHYESAPQLSSVQEFFHLRMKTALDEIKQTKIKEGATVWKLYDHGFIIRTASVTLAFDLIRGYSSRGEGFPVSDEFIKEMVDECDILFLSHRHGDHSDETVAQFFLDQNKPVVAPDEVWRGKPIHAELTHITPEPHKLNEIQLQNGKPALKAVIYPGHQGSRIQNNVSLVTSPEGLSFCHTGDQSNDEDFVWIDRIKDHHHVDVLMTNCWTTDIDRMAKGVNPGLIITGHENELGHTIDHREPYWLTYDRLYKTDHPYLLMTWGESFHYNKGN